MNSTTPIRTGVILLLVLSAGCILPDFPGRNGSVKFLGEFDVSDDSFQMDGTIEQNAGSSGRATFEDVSVCLYAADRELLHEEPIGRLESRRNVSVNLTTVPHYVEIYSPGFWDEPVEVRYYVKANSSAYEYHPEWATSADELPVAPRTVGSAGCPP